MPVWILEQIKPYRSPPPDAVSNYDIKKITVRAKDDNEARKRAAMVHPEPETRRQKGRAATLVESPFETSRESTCIEMPADDPNYPGDDPMSPFVVSVEMV